MNRAPTASPTDRNPTTAVLLPPEAEISVEEVGLLAAWVGLGLGVTVGGGVVLVAVMVAGPGVGVSVAGGVTNKTSF